MTESTEPAEEPSRWWSSDLIIVLVMLAMPVTAYGCEMARDVEARREVWKQCASAKEMTEQCRIILGTKP